MRWASVLTAVCITTSALAADADAVATVNGEPITREELVEELLIRHGKAVLEDMIRQRAVEQKVRQAHVAVTEVEIENEIKRERIELAAMEKRRLKANPDAGPERTLEQVAEDKYHMSFEGYREIIRRWLLIRKLILRRETPNENEIMLWFYQNRSRYDTPPEVTVRHIYIRKEDPQTGKPREYAQIQARIDLVRRELMKGEDFGALARHYSEDPGSRLSGGELGTINERAARATLEPSFVDAMMALKPGQAGGPIETPRGYHFIQVTARREGRRVEFEDIRARVKIDYMEERALLLREVFLREVVDAATITRNLTLPTGK